MGAFQPNLTQASRAGVPFLRDEGALAHGFLVAFTGRDGGVSAPPYDSLNLARRVGDDHAAVDENRRRAAAAAGFDGEALVLARQLHGIDILEAAPGDAGVIGEADGLVARRPGSVVAILTADCAPVVLAGSSGVAVLHAGWRGLVAGVVAAGVRALGDVAAAWVGPSIHACCYEVGPEVTDAFRREALPVAGEGRVDPGRAACVALRRAGVTRLTMSTECTSCSPGYFSFRRDSVTGRQGAFAALVTNGDSAGLRR